MNKIVIATNNEKKLNEIEMVLSGLNIQAIPQSHFKIGESEEPFKTFIENALIKARYASEKTGLPAIADDSGLCVDILGGEPGIYSARFSGSPRSDENNNLKLLKVLKDKNIRMVINKNSMLLADENLDITDDIIKILNNKLKTIKLN